MSRLLSARSQLSDLKYIERVVSKVPLEEPPNRISVTLFPKKFPGLCPWTQIGGSERPSDPHFHVLVPSALRVGNTPTACLTTISTDVQINSLDQALSGDTSEGLTKKVPTVSGRMSIVITFLHQWYGQSAAKLVEKGEHLMVKVNFQY